MEDDMSTDRFANAQHIQGDINDTIYNLKPITMTDIKEPTGINNPKWNPEDNTKQRKIRTPRNAESITKGALFLSLKERCKLVETLKESISAEVETINAAAKEATSIANGLG